MSQLVNKKTGRLDEGKVTNMNVVQGGLDIGRGGSFYQFTLKEGIESGLVILDMMGLENDLKP
jgi:hypothetical protein